jgi:hypothetical protein
VATAHLESLDMSHFRRTQLILASELLAKFDHAFFMGDFNFDATTNFNDPNEPVLENNNIRYYMPQFVDTWQNLHPDQLGATFDTTTNLMVMNSKRQKIVRYVIILIWVICEEFLLQKYSRYKKIPYAPRKDPSDFLEQQV